MDMLRDNFVLLVAQLAVFLYNLLWIFIVNFLYNKSKQVEFVSK